MTKSGPGHSTPVLEHFDNFHDHDSASQLDSTESKEAESIPNLKQLTFVKGKGIVHLLLTLQFWKFGRHAVS